MSCRCSTLKYIPQRACQAFGEVLSATLRKVISDNSAEVWTLLFMLPKCVLPPGNHGSSSQGKGKSTQIPIEQLCKMWSAGNIQALWQLAVAAGQSTHRRSPSITYSVEEAEENKIAAALACARDGLYSKACSILTSSCLAFNCEETFAHLKSKHPFRPSSNSSLPIIGQSRSSVSSQSTVCANFSNMIKQQLLVGLRECEFSTSLMQ